MPGRISGDPDILHGKPRVEGTRIAVAMVLELLEAGLTFDQITTDYYPQLTRDVIAACVRYARSTIESEEVHFVQELTPA